MTRDIRFYLKNGRWFADVSETIEYGGTEDDNEMIAGADDWLDMLSNYGDAIILKVSDDELLKEKLSLHSIDEGNAGATYISYEYDELPINFTMWLCAVTTFIFGEYPKTIYYKIVK